MKKQTTVKVTAMAKGTFKRINRKERFKSDCKVKKKRVQKNTNLEGSWVVGEAVSMDEHAQGCQGDKEPARKRCEVDELVDFPCD